MSAVWNTSARSATIFAALGHVVGIGITGFDAGSSFDDDFQSGFFEIGNDCRYQGDPPLPGKSLAGNTYQHEGPSTVQAQSGELSILPVKARMCTGTCGRQFQNRYPCAGSNFLVPPDRQGHRPEATPTVRRMAYRCLVTSCY